MAKIIIDEDCRNAPKKQFVRDFLIAVANSEIKAAADMLADSITLEIVGHTSVSGKESVMQLLTADEKKENISELVVRNILSHGNKCAADGILRFEDSSEVAFCDMYTFTSHSKDAKIKDITAYLIGEKSE